MSDIHLGRGTPDWGIPTYEGSASQVDIGQVQASLIRFDRIDQRGRISFVETWDTGINSWTRANFGTATLPDIVTQPAGISFVPPCCLRMTPGVPGTDVSYVTREVYLGISARLGLEAAVAFSQTSGDVFLQIEYKPTGLTPRIARMWYQPVVGTWSIETGAGAVVIATRPAITINLYQQVKMVADWATNRYVAVAIGDERFDLAGQGHTLLASVLSQNARCIVKVMAGGGAAGSGRALCGYVVLTRDEP